MGNQKLGLEVLALLVQATVFKIAGSHGNHVIGGFDSHALPPFSLRSVQADDLTDGS